MGIARKVLGLNLILTLAAMLLVFGVGHRVRTNGYLKLEAEELLATTNRTTDLIEADGLLLATMVKDWGAWDELYDDLTANKTQQFVEHNLTKETINNFRLDFALICEPNGKIIAIKGVAGYEQRIRNEAAEQALKIAAMLPHELRPQSLRHGIILFNETPMLVAAQRISRTDFSGISPGILIFARAIDKDYLDELQQREKTNIVLRSAPQGVTGTVYLQKIINDERIMGQRLLSDFYGEKSCLLTVTLERKIFRQGEQMMKEYAL